MSEPSATPSSRRSGPDASLALARRRRGAATLERRYHDPVVQRLLHPGKRRITQVYCLQRHAIGRSALIEITVLQESLDCVVELSIEVTVHYSPHYAARLRAALAFNLCATRHCRFCSAPQAHRTD